MTLRLTQGWINKIIRLKRVVIETAYNELVEL